MNQPVIVDAARTPFGKREGWLSTLHAADLLATAQRGVLDRTGVDPATVEQVIGGCVTPVGEQFGNITRTAWLHAGLPPATAVTNIEAQCGTGAQTVALLAGQIALGTLEVGMATGVEVMSRVPLTLKKGLGLGTPRPATWAHDTPDQYVAADRIVERRGFTRAELDAFGARSQERAAKAWADGRFDREIIPVQVPGEDGTTTVTRDQGLRATSPEVLAGLRTITEGGHHTAGTSSQVSDGASAALLMSERRAADLGLAPRGRLVAQAAVGGDLHYMLDAPIDAARIVLDRAGMSVDDVDVFEVNEAFASVPMSFARVLGVDEAKLNPNGGAIALGHPAGATGIRLVATALGELERTDKEHALIAICAATTTMCLLLRRG